MCRTRLTTRPASSRWVTVSPSRVHSEWSDAAMLCGATSSMVRGAPVGDRVDPLEAARGARTARRRAVGLEPDPARADRERAALAREPDCVEPPAALRVELEQGRTRASGPSVHRHGPHGGAVVRDRHRRARRSGRRSACRSPRLRVDLQQLPARSRPRSRSPPAATASRGWPSMWKPPTTFGASGGRGGVTARRPTTSTSAAASAATAPSTTTGDHARGRSGRATRAPRPAACWRAAASTRSCRRPET